MKRRKLQYIHTDTGMGRSELPTNAAQGRKQARRVIVGVGYHDVAG
jgi:hypothetical protein